MRRLLGRLTLVVLLSFGLAVACGSEDDKKHVTDSDAGEAGQAGAPTNSAGSSSRAGEPTVIEAGAGGAIEPGAGGAAGQMTQGGQAGEPPPGGDTGMGGQPACCQPMTCEDFADVDCTSVDDGCGTQIYCCADCVADPCGSYDCGAGLDNCGKPRVCPDVCSSQSSGLECDPNSGTCTGCEFQCHLGDCGPKPGCGGILDCTGFTDCEGTDTCQPNGTCCTPVDNCGPGVCSTDDGCGNLVDCGVVCQGDTTCLDHLCQLSECKDAGYECGRVFNILLDGDEDCGSCQEGLVCANHTCMALCLEPG